MRTRVVWILAAFGGLTLAALMRAKRQSAKQTPEAQLQQWENEGGSPAAPSPDPQRSA